ncbi:hypothetical protein [Amycolatopsis rubida]|uniref:Uncharacterized protein n=1 Tax=Amycolatopsis rubida TaxID=112413 RepID=A0A1I5IGN6_9PSEU|nr:hypothetical protein [Amycolatopsis rubida]SFO59592.1 hypothetical protein SAMN05421854_102455 [Amycolatopsis rubida]
MAVVNADADGFWSAMPRQNSARQGRALVQSLYLGGSQSSPMSAVRSGVIPTTGDALMAYDLRVTVQSGRTLLVQPGSAVVGRTGQGGYLSWKLPAATTVTCDSPPATNPRNDIVVLRVYDTVLSDTVQGGGSIPARIEIVTGTPGATPVDPVTWDSLGLITSGLGAGGGTAIPLARAQVSTGGVVTLTDLRRSTGLIGGVRVLLPGDSLSDPSCMPGDIAWYNGHRYWDGTAWQELSSSLGYAKGLLAKNVYAGEGVFGTQTEIVGDKASFTFDPARSYQFEWQGTISSSADRPYMTIGWRAANGATVTSSSPLVYSTLLPLQGNGKFHGAHLTCPVSGAALAALGLSAGTVTAAITHYITAGNGGSGWQARGDNGAPGALPNKRHFAVFDTGLSR